MSPSSVNTQLLNILTHSTNMYKAAVKCHALCWLWDTVVNKTEFIPTIPEWEAQGKKEVNK